MRANLKNNINTIKRYVPKSIRKPLGIKVQRMEVVTFQWETRTCNPSEYYKIHISVFFKKVFKSLDNPLGKLVLRIILMILV